jgi:hypothetical protein
VWCSDVDSNQLQELPVVIGSMKSLRSLKCSKNPFKARRRRRRCRGTQRTPVFMLRWAVVVVPCGAKLQSKTFVVPQSVVKEGDDAILAFLRNAVTTGTFRAEFIQKLPSDCNSNHAAAAVMVDGDE